MGSSHQEVGSPTVPTSLAPEGVLRWGERALWVMLVGGLALTAATAWLAPSVILFLPLGLTILLVGGWLFQHSLLNLLTLLAGYAFIISPEPGIQPSEALYGVYFLIYLVHWYGTRFIKGDTKFIQTHEDRLATLVLILGVLGGAVLGLLMGSPLEKLRGEAMALGMFAFYFPIREACLRYERAPVLLLGVVLWLGVFVAVRNFLHLEEILLAATQSWHIADARFATNETQLVVASLATLLLTVTRGSWLIRAGAFLLFLLLFSGLILTKSRAYWLAFLFGAFCIVLFMNRADRRRFLVLATVGAVSTVGAVLMFFGNEVVLLADGVIRRFATLDSAFSQDISLINRFVETNAVWDRIVNNPLLGYGLGHVYDYHSLVFLGHLETAFIHNGYVWLWYKLGLWGLALFLLFYGRAIWAGIRVYKRAPVRYQTYGLWSAVTLLGLAPAFLTSNGFPLPDVMIVHVILVSLACALRARYDPTVQGGAHAP